MIFVNECGLVDLVIAHLAVHIGADVVMLLANVRVLGTIVTFADVGDLVVVDVFAACATMVFIEASRCHVGARVVNVCGAAAGGIIFFGKL